MLEQEDKKAEHACPLQVTGPRIDCSEVGESPDSEVGLDPD